MPASGIKLADSNVWLALVFSDHHHHTRAKQWFDVQQDGSVAFCRITQLALLRHLTNSSIMSKFVQSQQAAWETYDTLSSDPRVIFVEERPGLEPIL
jgi:predicted nucleic acid-binding protein